MAARKHVTIKDVARRAGVSYQTVSKLINGQVRLMPETEQRIWEAVHALNYRTIHSARSLRSQNSRTLGYSWTPSRPDRPNFILDTLLQSMVTTAEEHDYQLLCFAHQSNTQRLLDTYQQLYDSGRVDGFILSSIEFNDPRIEFLLRRDIPFTAFGRSNPELTFPCIDVDGGEGIRLAAQHLHELGHTRIAVLAWPESSRVGTNRLDGYLSFMHAAGIDPLPQWMQRGVGQHDFGCAATHQFLELDESIRPTAIIALNDMMAIGALQAAHQRGIHVGGELAVTGFDDTPLASYVRPTLTSLRQPMWTIGQQLVMCMVDVLTSGSPERKCSLLIPELIVRESSCMPKP